MGLGTKLWTMWWNCVDRLQIIVNPFFVELVSLLLKLVYSILSVGPLPNHMAFIMDGNRGYAKKHKQKEVEAYQNGSSTLLSTLKYCSELAIKYVTVYAFSIDNFKRSPEDVKVLMDLMLAIMERLIADESFIKEHGVRICFAGNLRLLNEPVRVAAEKIITASADNTKTILLICIAYTSTEEIVHAVQETCLEKRNETVGSDVYKEKVPIIGLTDIENHMYMAQAPEPDVLVRTSGESVLATFSFGKQEAACCITRLCYDRNLVSNTWYGPCSTTKDIIVTSRIKRNSTKLDSLVAQACGFHLLNQEVNILMF